MSKCNFVILCLLLFCIATLCYWLTKLAPLSQPMGIQTKNQLCFCHTRFPALGASYMYLLRILIGSLCCLHLLQLVRVITLVLVLRHSIGNRSVCNCVPSLLGCWYSNKLKFLPRLLLVSKEILLSMSLTKGGHLIHAGFYCISFKLI